MPAALDSAVEPKSTSSPRNRKVPAVALVDAGHDLDQRRLAGAVLADEGVDRAGVDGELPDRRATHGAEGLGDVAQLEDRSGHGGDSRLKGFNSYATDVR